jgi:RecA-family ATPase
MAADKLPTFEGLWDWRSVMRVNVPHVPFYLEPYIPQHGVVLIHGKWGTYKTPLTFNMALAVAKGDDIWGLKVTEAPRVLYVEMDTHSTVLIPRLQRLDPHKLVGDNLHVAFYQPGPNAINPGATKRSRKIWEVLYQAHNGHTDDKGTQVVGYSYDLIFWDSLRCLHAGDDKGSETPHILYNALLEAFPGACHVLVHHDRKARADDTKEMGPESFSGSQAWINHATVAVHVRHANKDKNQIVLEHTKSHASELASPLVLQVEDGAAMQTAIEASKAKVTEALEQLND